MRTIHIKTFATYSLRSFTTSLITALIITTFSAFAGHDTNHKKRKTHSLKISGVVRDETGRPVENVFIDILENGEIIDYMTSDKKGLYNIKITPNTQFSINIHKECYKVKNVEIEETVAGSSKKVTGYQITIYMTKLAEEESQECYSMSDPEPVTQIDFDH